MLVCPACNGENSEGSKFCFHCGYNLKSTANGNVFEGAQSQQDAAATSESEPQMRAKLGNDSNQYVEKAKTMGSNYWHYLKESIKIPSHIGIISTRANFTNGLITLILFVLFSGVLTATYTRLLTSALNFNFFDISLKFSFTKHFLKPVLFNGLSLAILVLILFAIINFIMGNRGQITELVGRFGTLMLLPTLLLGIASLFALFGEGAFKVVAIVNNLSSLTFITAIVFTIYSYRRPDSKGIDPFYCILIAFVGLAIINSLFSASSLDLGSYLKF